MRPSAAIVAVDPGSPETRTIFESGGRPMGASSVAVLRSGELFMGSFTGDRIVRTALP